MLVPVLVVPFGHCAELLDAGGLWRLKLSTSHQARSTRAAFVQALMPDCLLEPPGKLTPETVM